MNKAKLHRVIISSAKLERAPNRLNLSSKGGGDTRSCVLK
uniref:Uncharacterized protein n=1 Tax=Nelumbo nucifera TaxID=4432 RepID=A0A822Z0Y8_NELNU|nr:TPA_asm: hypothetical protein HUJ06_007776 [Nelumbo nucifera]